jgi:hypothetical protein
VTLAADRRRQRRGNQYDKRNSAGIAGNIGAVARPEKGK